MYDINNLHSLLKATYTESHVGTCQGKANKKNQGQGIFYKVVNIFHSLLAEVSHDEAKISHFCRERPLLARNIFH